MGRNEPGVLWDKPCTDLGHGKEDPELPVGGKFPGAAPEPEEIPEQLLEAERCRARLGFLGISWDLMGIFGLVLQAPGGGGAGAWKNGAGSGGKQREVRMERDQRDGVHGKVDF